MKLSDLTIPAVAECDPKVEPMHAKVLIAPASVPEKVGSLIMAAASHEKAVFANQRARIVALGPVAFQFEDWPAGARKPQVGDVILHESYIGEEVEGEDGRKYRLINDRAVMAVLERADELNAGSLAETVAKVRAHRAATGEPLALRPTTATFDPDWIGKHDEQVLAKLGRGE